MLIPAAAEALPALARLTGTTPASLDSGTRLCDPVPRLT